MNLPRHLQRQPQINVIATGSALLAVTVLALFLRLHLLGQDSFWGDELASVRRAQMGWDAFWELMRGIPAMALYYALLRFWILLGDSEFTVRLLSVIPAVATIPVVYFLGKRLFDARVGLISALLLAMNALHIQYSQEARSYSLLILLVALSSLFLARGVQRPSWLNWTGYALASALSVYTHPFALLVLLAQASSFVFLPRRDIPWSGLCLSGLALGFALLPVLAPAAVEFVDFDSAENATPLGWIPEISLDRVHGFAVDLTGKDGDLLFLAYLIPILVSGIAAIRTWVSARASFESWKYALLLAWLFLPIAITLGYSLLIAPALVPRYLTICLPPLALLSAVGIVQIYQALSIRRGPLSMGIPLISGVLVAALVTLSARGASAYYADFVKEDWRGTASLIMSHWQPGDGILFYVTNTEKMLRHYIDRSEAAPEISPLVPVEGRWRHFLAQEPDRERIAQYLPDHAGRVWLVMARNHSTPSRLRMTNELHAALRSKYQDVQRWYDDGHLVRVSLYSSPVPGVFGGHWEEIAREIRASQVRCYKLPLTIMGTDGDDQIASTEGDDVIHGLDGNDTINGLSGNDTICGGNGNDLLDGGEGDDLVNGFAGDDIVRGSLGDDAVYGSSGNDQLFGDDGDDKLAGGPGSDELNGSEGDDVLNSGEGNNLLDGGSGVDVCQGRGSNQNVNCP